MSDEIVARAILGAFMTGILLGFLIAITVHSLLDWLDRKYMNRGGWP